MPITPTLLRTNFPEFSDIVVYPDAQVQFWLDTSYSMLDTGRWGRQLDMAAQLYTAHNLVLEARAQKEAAAGGLPGGAVGVLSSKGVDKVSAGYDTSVATEEGGGHWNLTIYGTRLYRLIKLFGAGPITVSIGSGPPFSGPAWPGPMTNPGFTNF